MAMLHYEIVSPERLLADADATMVVVPGVEGDFAVLAGHAPFMSTMRAGVIAIHTDSDTKADQQLFVKGGLAQIAPSGLTILAEEAIDLDSVDATDLQTQMTNLRDELAAEQDDAARARIEAELGWMQALADIAE